MQLHSGKAALEARCQWGDAEAALRTGSQGLGCCQQAGQPITEHTQSRRKATAPRAETSCQRLQEAGDGWKGLVSDEGLLTCRVGPDPAKQAAKLSSTQLGHRV